MGVEVFTDMKPGLKDVDIVMMLRLQTERMQGTFVPSTREYFHFFGLDHEKLEVAKPDALVMHPGPMNRGVEIDSEVADDIDRSLIREQVEMGVAVRMACLDALAATRHEPPSDATDAARPLFTNARLLDPATGRDEIGDLLIDRGGKIAALGAGIASARTARESSIAPASASRPAWSTCASQLGEPGEEQTRPWLSASRAAAAGGITTLAMLPDTDAADRRCRRAGIRRPPRPRGQADQDLRLWRRDQARQGRELAEMGLLAEAGAVGFTDGVHAIGDALVDAPRAVLRQRLRPADRPASGGAEPGRRRR